MDREKIFVVLNRMFMPQDDVERRNLYHVADEILRSQWISCEDRLPEKSFVLGYNDYCAVCLYAKENNNFYEWNVEKNEYSEKVNATHWQPLPVAPEDK